MNDGLLGCITTGFGEDINEAIYTQHQEAAKMGSISMRRHTDRYDVVWSANLIKLGREMAFVSIQDQETISSFGLAFRMWNEVFLEPINAYFITCPSIWTMINIPVFSKAIKPS
jgi:hypothetical protein